MSLSVSEIQRKVETMTSQQEFMFNFIEKGLCQLSKQLDTISKNNKVNEEVIHHLQAVVRDSFERINTQEQEIAELHEKQSQLGDCVLNLCQTLDNKMRRVQELQQELKEMREKQDTIALSNMWIYPAEPEPNHIMIPASPSLQPSLAPQWEFDPFYL
jgi:DNA repair exonuclease SbcCD ATPase subunit